MAAITPYWEKQTALPKSPLPTYFDPAGGGPGTKPYTPVATPATPTGPSGPGTPKGPTTPPVPAEKKKIGKGLLGLIGLFSPLLHDLIQKNQNDDALADIQAQIDAAGNVQQGEGVTAEDFLSNPAVTAEQKQQVADALGVTVDQLVEMFGGYPIVQGYVDPTTGEFVIQKIFTSVTGLLDLKEISQNVPGLDEWQQQQGYDLTGINEKMGSLSDLMAAGPSGEDNAAARQWQSENMGFENFEQYQAYLQGQMGRSEQGLSEQERADWDRATEIGVRQIRDDKLSMVESMGMESTGRMFREIDQISLGMGDARASREMQKYEYEMAKQAVAFQQYITMAETGTGQQQMYHDMAFQNRMGALQGYAQQATMIMQQYGTELEGMQIHANIVYQSIMADMGYDQHVMDQIQSQYELDLMPLLTELDLMMTQYELDTSNQFSYLDIALQLLPTLLG